MPTIHLEAQVSSDELLKDVAQLSPAEFEQFVSRLMALRAQRQAPRSSSSEADLLPIITQGLPEELGRRYGELVAKRGARTLTPEEHAELLRLNDQVEQWEGKRLEALVQLARQRQMSLEAVMKDLGIQAPSHG